MFCTQCGERVPEGSRYCPACGQEVHGISAPKDNVVENESTNQTVPQPTPTREEIDSAQRVRPWVRYWARMFDVVLFSLPAGFLIGLVIGLVFPNAFNEPGSEHIGGIVILFSWAFVEAGLLSTFGTTPGKALFKVRLTCTSSSGFTYSSALNRSIKVWWRGLGTGFPIVSLVTLIVAYNKLTRNLRTSWDADGGYIVQHERIGPARVFFAIAFFVAFFMLIVAGEAMNHTITHISAGTESSRAGHAEPDLLKTAPIIPDGVGADGRRDTEHAVRTAV